MCLKKFEQYYRYLNIRKSLYAVIATVAQFSSGYEVTNLRA
jgi:hypothetical protein